MTGQRAFRRPTLNELYRPFRQGSAITESNAALKTEHATSAEAGVEYTFHTLSKPQQAQSTSARRQAAPAPRRITVATVGLTTFWNELTNAVTNVTVVRGPATDPRFGTLPAGTIGRQRLNLERVRIRGVEASATWKPAAAVSFSAAYLLSDSRVMHSVVAPALTGKRLAEVPRHSASVGVTWNAPAAVRITSRVRWLGRQFDDDENEIRLGEAVVADVGLSRPLGKNVELFLNIENAGNVRIETARTATGIVSTGTPRFAYGGIRGSW